MSKPSRRPTREAGKQHKQKRRAAQRQLRARRAEVGRSPLRAASVSNRLCPYSTEAKVHEPEEDHEPTHFARRHCVCQCLCLTCSLVRHSKSTTTLDWECRQRLSA
jgi:hypothetical protein